VDKQRCVSGVSSDFRCCIAPTTQDGSVSFSNAHHYFIDSIVLIVPSFRFCFPAKYFYNSASTGLFVSLFLRNFIFTDFVVYWGI
jgi:hypothetical protein